MNPQAWAEMSEVERCAYRRGYATAYAEVFEAFDLKSCNGSPDAHAAFDRLHAKWDEYRAAATDGSLT